MRLRNVAVVFGAGLLSLAASCPIPDIPFPIPTPPASPSPTPVPSPKPTPVPTPEPSPVPTPVPTPTPEPSPEPTPPAENGCFPPTKPVNKGDSCPWGACLSECPPIFNYGIYWEQVVRRVGNKNVTMCLGHTKSGHDYPGCFEWAEKQRNVKPGDKLHFGASPRTEPGGKDPVTGEHFCCWYDDARKTCELPHGCPTPFPSFGRLGVAGPPIQQNGYSMSFIFQGRIPGQPTKALACPPQHLINPVTGKPFQGTQGCNERTF